MMLQERNFNKILLTALLVGAVSTASAWTDCGTNIQYEINGTTLVLQSPNPAAGAIVTSKAFESNTTITEVVIPYNVTEIGVEAFHNCSSLQTVYCRPYTAPSLGTDGFTGCATGLTIYVPNLGSYNQTTNNWYHYTPMLWNVLDEYDEQAIAEDKIEGFKDASVSDIDIFRTLRKAGCFNTLTLPFNVPNIASSPLGGDNVEVYAFSSATVEDGTLVLDIEKVTSNSLTAGTPYLIQWTNSGEVLNRMHFEGISWDDNQTAETASSTHVNYVGFYGRTHIDDDANHSNLFLGGNNTLYWPTDGNDSNAKMLGFRAYFHINTSSPSPAHIYRGMPAYLRIKSTPTDVNSVTSNPSPVTEKVLRNGQIIIIRNREQYSITGQKL